MLWKRLPNLDVWIEFLEEFHMLFPLDTLPKKRVFVLGSYSPEPYRRLNALKNAINSAPNLLAFLMSDFKKFLDENIVERFSFLASFTDALVMVVEHDIGGHMMELGIIVSKKGYYEKTGVFVLEGVNLSQMLEKGAFKLPFFKVNSNLFYFKTTEQLIEKALDFIHEI